MLSINREEIIKIFKKNIKKIIIGWDEDAFDPDHSLKEVGLDSLDSIHVLLSTLKDLGIKVVQLHQLNGNSINELIDSLASKLKEKK